MPETREDDPGAHERRDDDRRREVHRVRHVDLRDVELLLEQRPPVEALEAALHGAARVAPEQAAALLAVLSLSRW